MSTRNPTERSSKDCSDGLVKQTVPGADYTVTIEKSDIEAQTDPAFARKTIGKIGIYVLPILAVLHSFSLIDRVNIA